MKLLMRKLFNMRDDVGINFYITDFLFRKIFRQNSKVGWAIHHTSTVIHPEKITKGKNVYPGDSPGNYIQAKNGIEIGDYTNIGPNVGIISANHNLLNNASHDKAQPIKIGKHCWIGMNAMILPEVALGDYTIVGANAVVTKSFPEGYCVIAGNPAKIIKKISSSEIQNNLAGC
jgi:acetyltransferase-like isoleucine patch superfamily enzyme